ncbi:hypothetical protein [Clostridium tyrobutyricum]|jgi:hypothetical protein|uniref:hypothetical protein n=1 Tax=Clostridium tyrobutyricum TaxID=1519 RepID=UPI0002EF8509|nr:hypothetical protein [Clostridium tyrobutyricum]MBV4423629.1 hypothetical protein [Clostridium tyrobutyricum]MBV4425311.1 hypothetical protein [Clostridium tyrobutyricum]MBV4438704.1 hypothetical protein [Clostridium tyrobutyricum]
MAKYRKKPIVIEAVVFYAETSCMMKLSKFLPFKVEVFEEYGKKHFIIPTLEGAMRATEGDYIIKGVDGEYYACKPDIFEKTYDFVEK